MANIEALYDSVFASLYWSAYGIMRDSERAKDAVQTVFMKALAHRSVLERLTDEQAAAWLRKTARNQCLNELRDLRREYLTEIPAESGADEAAFSPESTIVRMEERERVKQLIDALPQKYRAPILLYYFAELPQKEIAAALGMKESTLRSILRRAKLMLQKAMTEGGVRIG